MSNVAAYLYGQLLLWRVRLVFPVAPVGDFVATHGIRHLAHNATWKPTLNISSIHTSLSTGHASFVTRCTRPTSATPTSIFLVAATDTPIDLIRREAIQRPADSS